VARGGPLLPEHFPRLATIPAAADPAGQLAGTVRLWLADKIQEGGAEIPTHLYADLLQSVEPVLLEEVMRHVQGNRQEAARWLGLNRATVRKLLARYFPTSSGSD
jgi:DNA-binding protein Fis